MTVIAGLVDGGKVYLGADRGMSDKHFIATSLTPKLRKVGPLAIGYSASRGTGQLTHFVNYPEPNIANLEAWLRIEFCEAIQKASDMFKIDINTEDNGADILVGIGGRLFEIGTEDWSVSEYEYIATGSGYSYALGSLHTTSSLDIPPRKRITMAVGASIKHSPSCSSPIDVVIV
jgi:hypothetical protein